MKTSTIFPSRFLRAADLQGRRVSVVIEKLLMEDIGNEKRAVMYFKDKTKALVLNKTNIRTMEEIAGDETDNWRGVRIIFYPTRVDYQGRRVDAIRIDRVSADGNGAGDGAGRSGAGKDDDATF